MILPIIFLFIFRFESLVFNLKTYHSYPPKDAYSMTTLGGPCCCGVNRELTFNNFDFESAPIAPPGGWIDYAAGQMYDGWNVTSGSISIHHPTHGNMGAGNPNGASQHMDLHGGTPGAVLYPLTGLTAGYSYTIELWYAIHIAAPSATANLKIEGGAWLNTSWTAFNPGNSLWLKASYMFIAKGSTTTLELIGSGPLAWGGMLIDDIHLYECPGDTEKPIASSIPNDLMLSCIKDVPAIDAISFTDNCDLNPSVNFEEKKQGPPCDQIITRSWKATDKCGNLNEFVQKITIKDDEQPSFVLSPKDTILYCPSNVDSVFNLYLLQHGGATANDNCLVDHWDYYFNHKPRSFCDTSIVNFIVYDACMNSNSIPSFFIVKDTTGPKLSSAINVQLDCGINGRDSLSKWLDNNGYAVASDHCSGKLVWKNNFNGDSLASEIKVLFTVTDECGNDSETTGTFRQSPTQVVTRIQLAKCNLKSSYSDTTIFSRTDCDSTVIRTYFPARRDVTLIENPTCDSMQSSIDSIFLMNTEFCDSIIVISRPYVMQKITVDSMYDCFLSSVKTDSIHYVQQPCDSIHVMVFVPAVRDEVYLKKWTCDPNLQGIDSSFYINTKGCDSLIIVETIYVTNVQTIVDTSICRLSNEYADTLKLKGQYCDSLVIYNFHTKRSDTSYLTRNTCDKSYAGEYTRHFTNAQGCDSILIENILFTPSDTVRTTSFYCEPPNATYDTTFYKNKNGCDSIRIQFNHYIKKDTLTFHSNTCDSSQSGIFFKLLKGRYCDSLVITNIHWIKSDTGRIELYTCHVEEVKTEIKNISRINDCDSIVLISSIYVKPSLQIGSEDIHCFHQNDGKISLENVENLHSPLRYFLNYEEVKDTSLLHKLSKGVYTFFVMDSNACISDSVQITINEPDSLYIHLGSDTTLTHSQQILLTSETNGKNLIYNWSPPSIFDCPHCDRSIASIDSTTLIHLMVEDENGCTAQDEMLIRFIDSPKVWAPNAFSPNGDQINDYFTIYGEPNARIIWLRIYDRWGELVYHTTNIPVNVDYLGWSGQFRNQELKPGVYLYHALVEFASGEEAELSGDVTLIR